MAVANPLIAPPYCPCLPGQVAPNDNNEPSRSDSADVAVDIANLAAGMVDVFESPHDTVPLHSPFYVKRSPVEEQASTALAQPGGLVRLRAAAGMGKASLLLRVVAFAKTQNFRVVHIDSQSVDPRCCEDGDRFLRWLCCAIAHQLKLENELDQYWDDDVGSRLSCTAYLDEYILESVDSPVLLIFSDVDGLLEYSQIAHIVFPLLRFWHEQAKYTENFLKLRILLSGATESYVELDVNQSPFNVGLTLQLAPFTLDQVHDLAMRHNLDWQRSQQSHQLTALTGGHPYLVRIALDYFSHQNIGLEPSPIPSPHTDHWQESSVLTAQAITPEPSPEATQTLAEMLIQVGIYDKHLRGHYATLQQYPELLEIMKKLVMISPQAGLDILSIHSHHLHNLGLVTIKGDRVFPACDLYRYYFQQQFQLDEETESASSPQHGGIGDSIDDLSDSMAKDLGESIASPQSTLLAELEAENRHLRALVHQDDLTKISNRRYFDKMLTSLWQQVSSQGEPLALILIDIDHFKQYNDTYGHQQGDRCLHAVAQALQAVVNNTGINRSSSHATNTTPLKRHLADPILPVVARYGGEEFAIILPYYTPLQAQAVSDSVHGAIRQLNIEHRTSSVSSRQVTVSMGIASMLPVASYNPSVLVMAADDALYQAKHGGRDRTTVYIPQRR